MKAERSADDYKSLIMKIFSIISFVTWDAWIYLYVHIGWMPLTATFPTKLSERYDIAWAISVALLFGRSKIIEQSYIEWCGNRRKIKENVSGSI